MSDLETSSGKTEKTENFPVEKLIRAELRPHVTAFYIFARAADDVADNPLLDAQEKTTRLDAFAAALTAPATSEPIASVTPLRESLAATGVTPQHALDLLTAFKRDAVQRRYQTWDELMDYCRYSASPVGRHVLALHGIGQEAWPANDALCSALQVLNHLQDCADDYRELDRVYLPLDILAGHDTDERALAGARSSKDLRATMDDILNRTDALIAKGRPLFKQVPDRHLRLDTAVIGEVARALAVLLRRRDPLCENVKLSRLAKFRALAFGAVRSLL